MVYVGGLIVILTAVAILKKFEVRLVLFTSGLLMATLAGNPLAAVTSFTESMVNPSLVPTICTVMGFVFVMNVTKCDLHLVNLLSGVLKLFKRILIPITVMLTFVINIALPSASGCAAAVGAVMIPTLINSGVHPAMAGAAVLAGTIGSVMSFGNSHNPYVADLADVSVTEVISVVAPATIVAGLIAAVSLAAIAFMRNEASGYVAPETIKGADKSEYHIGKVNVLKAIMPLVPLLILVVGGIAGIEEITVPMAMLIGTALGGLVSLSNPEQITKSFFDGMGSAYGNILGIIITATVFTSGMAEIGLTQALIDAMASSDSIVRIAGTFGPFLIAVLSGSGDAAAFAFNGAITPSAADFGLEITNLGSMASLAGSLGRSMSPVAGAAIICASLANVSPIELSKRNAPGMLIAAVAGMIILL